MGGQRFAVAAVRDIAFVLSSPQRLHVSCCGGLFLDCLDLFIVGFVPSTDDNGVQGDVGEAEYIMGQSTADGGADTALFPSLVFGIYAVLRFERIHALSSLPTCIVVLICCCFCGGLADLRSGGMDILSCRR